MKKLVTLVLFTLIFSAACNTSSPTVNKVLEPIAPLKLQSVTAKFRTTSDDKDDDTKLDVQLKKKDGTVLAEMKNIFGNYEDNSDHKRAA